MRARISPRRSIVRIVPLSVTIPVNHTRFNVKSSQDQEVTGMCLGVVNARSNGVVSSSFGRLRPNLTKTLCNFAKTAVPDFHFTSIQVNKNYMSALHVDKNNVSATLFLLSRGPQSR